MRELCFQNGLKIPRPFFTQPRCHRRHSSDDDDDVLGFTPPPRRDARRGSLSCSRSDSFLRVLIHAAETDGPRPDLGLSSAFENYYVVCAFGAIRFGLLSPF